MPAHAIGIPGSNRPNLLMDGLLMLLLLLENPFDVVI